jgi:hypothetical protein
MNVSVRNATTVETRYCRLTSVQLEPQLFSELNLDRFIHVVAQKGLSCQKAGQSDQANVYEYRLHPLSRLFRLQLQRCHVFTSMYTMPFCKTSMYAKTFLCSAKITLHILKFRVYNKFDSRFFRFFENQNILARICRRQNTFPRFPVEHQKQNLLAVYSLPTVFLCPDR